MQQSNINPLPLKSSRLTSLREFISSQNGSAAAVKTAVFSVLILAINVVTGVLTARFLGPEGRGEQAAMVNWSQFLAFSVSFGLPSALVYHAKKNAADTAKLYGVALVMGTGFGLVAMVAGILLLPLWLRAFDAQVVHFAQWAMVVCPLIVISQINNAILQVRGEYNRYNRLRYLVPLCTLLMLVVFIAVGAITPYTTALAYLLPSIPLFLAMTWRLWRIYMPKLRETGKQAKKLITYGMSSYGNDLIGQVAAYADQILIAGFLTPADLGLYAVAVSLARMVNIFATSITVVLFPKASGLPREEALALTFKAFRISTTVTLLASGALMLAAPLVINLLYGPDFKQALTVFRFLLLEASIGGGTLVLAQAFMALGKPKIVTLLQGTGLLLVVPLLFLLVPKYGLTGAGIAMLGSVLIRFAFIMINIRVTLKMRIPKLFLAREDIRWLIAAVKSYSSKKPAS
jgi:O-antigen/teichoic acid export membrane protein